MLRLRLIPMANEPTAHVETRRPINPFIIHPLPPIPSPKTAAAGAGVVVGKTVLELNSSCKHNE